MLVQEAALLASMRHPNVVNFFGICREPPCIITEFCSGGSLAEVLAEARRNPETAGAALTWQRRLNMMLHAAVGMLYLHSRPQAIIHRDLKSPNLLVDDNWRVKVSGLGWWVAVGAGLSHMRLAAHMVPLLLTSTPHSMHPLLLLLLVLSSFFQITDFNLSKLIADQGNSSVAAMNLRWLAPELMQGERATLASDVFAFGVVLWEAMTWQLPWGSANPWTVSCLPGGGGTRETGHVHACMHASWPCGETNRADWADRAVRAVRAALCAYLPPCPALLCYSWSAW